MNGHKKTLLTTYTLENVFPNTGEVLFLLNSPFSLPKLAKLYPLNPRFLIPFLLNQSIRAQCPNKPFISN